MKKIFLALAFIATVSLVSCNGTDKAAEEEASAVATATVDEIAPEDFQAQLDEAVANGDTTVINELIATANANYTKLAGEDETAAKDYLQKIKDIITKNTALASVVPGATNLIDNVAALPQTVKDVANEAGKAAVDSAKNVAANAVNDVKQATETKANEAVEKAQKKAGEAVDNAAKSAGDAAKKALGI